MQQQPSAIMTPRILWMALLVSCFIYAGISYFVLRKTVTVPADPMLPPILGVVAIGVAIASFVVPRMSYQQSVRGVEIATKEEAMPNAFPGRYREAAPKKIVFANAKAARRQAFVCFFTPFILSLALSEAVAIFGFVCAQLGSPPMISGPFFLVGAILIAIRFPTEPRILQRFERATNVSFPAENS